MEGIHVVVGRGPLGIAVVQELLREKRQVRVVGMSHRQVAFPKGVEVVTHNASDIAEAKKAFDGASTIYQCAGPPYHLWAQHFPDLMKGIIAGATYHHAKLVVGDNLYMYGDTTELLTETLPYQRTSKKGMIRAELADTLLQAHRNGRVKVAIARASDFFGPHVVHSTIGRVFPKLVKGKTVTILGNPDTLHTYTFIEDFAKALVMLANDEDAFGEIWHVPSPTTMTTRQFLTLAFELAGHRPKIRTMGRKTLKFGGLFNREAREVVELMYQFENPFVVSHQKFAHHFGDCSNPLEEALAKTVAWFNEIKLSQ